MAISVDSFPDVATLNYNASRSQIKSGDILLCSGASIFSALIKHVTKSVWSHVAFIIRLDAIDRVMVLESVESIGVRTVPLSSYINDYNASGKSYPGKMLIARHQQFNSANINNLSRFAVDLFGYPYATEDLVRIAARIGMKNFNFAKNNPLIQAPKAFICSEYAYKCYQSVGITIDYDTEGFIAPADFAKNSLVEAINFIQS